MPNIAYMDTDAGIGGLSPIPRLCLSLMVKRYES